MIRGYQGFEYSWQILATSIFLEKYVCILSGIILFLIFLL